MNSELLGLAFAAGTVAGLNPCGFAMLPAYLTLVVNRDGNGKRAAVGRALAATAAMTLRFLAVFGSFGLLTVAVASAVQRHLPYATLAVGAALIAAGIWLLAGRTLPGLNSTPLLRSSSRWVPTARLGSMVGYGAGYAIASLTCTIGPFLAVTGSSLRSGSALTTVLVYVAYALGLALVVGVLAVAVALASATMVERTRRILPYVNRISGLVLILVGLYVAYYGWFELRLFVGAGGATDPVIDAAGRVQRALAGWVYRNGAWPWLLTLAALAVPAVFSLAARRRRRAR